MADAIKDICSKQCGARCCKAPSRMKLTHLELQILAAHLTEEQQRAVPLYESDGLFELHFKDTGGACPFLDLDTNLCTIYEERPSACRKYPTVQEDACMIS